MKFRDIELAIGGDIHSDILEGYIWISSLKDPIVKFIEKINIDECFWLDLGTSILKQFWASKCERTSGVYVLNMIFYYFFFK